MTFLDLISFKQKVRLFSEKVSTRSGAVSESTVVFLSAIYMVMMNNKTMIKFIFNLSFASSMEGIFFKISTLLLAVSLLHIVLLLFFALNIVRPAVVCLVFIGAAADFFMNQYGVLIDGAVVASLFETTQAEARQFLSWQYLINLILFAGVFSASLFCFKMRPITWRRRAVQFFKFLFLNLIFLALLGAFSYKEYASFFRNNRQVRHMFNPVNSLYETFRYFQGKYFPKHKELMRIGMDAERIEESGNRKRFVVFVLGETARADHFSVNHYLRETNPELKKQSITSFENVWSCGTATAESVPCLFSNLGRENFNESAAENRENILDLVQRAGYQTTWIDNNTGCKGVCNRVDNIDLSKYWDSDLCRDGLCYDDVLLKPLKHLANNQSRDHFVVLHMVGSHGPTYYMRYPREFAVFQPECRTNQLIDCTREQVVNTYDNTILYTDHVLGGVITYLKTLSSKYDTAMVYISDHGESLGENGIYLHSLPYTLAPDEQKRVPFMVWLSESYKAQSGISDSSLKKRQKCRLSHDYIFHSVLSLLDVETREYRPELDIFNKNSHCLD